MNLDHSNIIKLIGICRDGSQTMMVQELAKYGSLLDYLLDHKGSINPRRELLLWAYQIACGMRYLEEQRFVHRDLAARNVLLAKDKVAKVGDFGLSRAMSGGDNVYQSAEGGKWPIKWYALEAIIYGTVSKILIFIVISTIYYVYSFQVLQMFGVTVLHYGKCFHLAVNPMET